MNNTQIYIAIPTYNRHDMLHRLIQQIVRESKGWQITIGIYDDCSTIPVTISPNIKIPHILYRFSKNNGKIDYWILADRIFKDFQNSKADFIIYMADDIVLHTGFFDTLIQQWNAIEDPDKATLSFFYDSLRRGKPCWGRFTPINQGNYWLTQWLDMAFLAPRHTLEVLNFEVLPVDSSRWKDNPLLSSGVGQQLSQRLRKLRLKMYHLDRDLADHGMHESRMHPEARRLNPLVGYKCERTCNNSGTS